ncbi:uncharacterized protein LOC117784219 [Drosophila innubila]|uniref:uncharacterized protein LOC117784219 n=1 Tax=Drosophila innubila TaxID=198719 RepID=UPI00148BFF46|nr:uncharacterized protein LOC117784219 [Drosophila innubila]
MELQNIYLSIFFTLLPDYLLHLFRMIGVMSSPIHDHYRCASSRRPQSKPLVNLQESEKARMMEKSAEETGNTGGGLLDTLQPEPLVAAMYSLQFVADVVNRVQSALHQCTTSQKPTKTASMTGIEFASSSEPSFCYFFIDMQPQYEFESCQDPDSDSNLNPDLKNISDKQSTDNSTAKTSFCNLERQRSISECSDDSFICFEDDSNSVDCSTFEQVDADFNSTDNTDDCKLDSQELRKRVRFNLKPEIHVMHTWDFAYRAARKGDWQEMARDRDRFQQRIKRVAPTINTILNSNHRDKVYKDRFLDVN